jgi:ribonuclease E
MGSKMLIDASHAEETRVVVIKGNRIEEFDFESAARRQLKGNIYLAKVTRVEPSLQAAFIEYGGNRHGFLAFSEIHPDYYQIPLADRMALIQAEEEEQAREADDEDEDEESGHGRRRERRGRGRDRDRRRDQAASGEDSQPASEAGEQPDTAEHPEQPGQPYDGGEDPEMMEAEAEADTETEDKARPPRAEPMVVSHDIPTLSEDAAPETGDDKSSRLPDSEEAPLSAAPAITHGMPGELGNGVEEVSEDPESTPVESIGAEDAMEEVPQRRRKVQRRQYKIQEVIKRRQVILVQVVKEERGNKGAALTTYLSLAGRYCVLMPNTARGGGISRKITEAGDRRRLKEMVKEIEVPQGMGLIVRTAGAQRTKTEIKRDYDYLLRLWESVRDLTLQSQAPALVYEEGSLVKRAIRDLYTKDVDEVIVEGDDAYREAKDFMKMLMPSHAKNVKLYKEPRPLFSRYQAEGQLDGLYSPTVTLPSGGYMVINQTEALVSVDINSGRSTREHNIEDTALRTNLEAADEIARQLRLRDLAGLIVIDFIDMEEKRNNRNVERRLKDALKNDRARIQVGHISHFGLLEMSRQRLRPGLLEGSSRTCPHCEGRGIVRSVSSCGLSVLRAIEEHLMARKPENLTVKCTREIAFYILNEKRDNLLAIETAYGISVFIVPSDDLKGSQALIERAPDRSLPPRRAIAAPVRIDSAFASDDSADAGEAPSAEAVPDEESEAEAEDEQEGGEEDQAHGQGERPEGGRRRRRRRGRRGGRGREGQPGETVAGLGDQPEIGFAGAVGEDTEHQPPAETAVVEDGPAPADESAASEREPRSGRPRRDRWGRSRERNRNEARAPREDAAPEATHAEPSPSSVPTPPAAVQPTPAEADASPAEPARRWQPPAPTVSVEPSERKAGWWSKRG